MRTGHSQGPGRSRSQGAGRPVAAASTDASTDASTELDRWVRVTCPACGVVRVRLDAVVLRNCVDDRTWGYRARCSRCGTLFLAPTPASLAWQAIAAGVRIEQWTLPTPSPRHSHGPISDVDVLELHLALLRPDWIDELARERPLE